MPKSPDRKPDALPGAYRPHVPARRPGTRPSVKPVFRVLVHRKYLETWDELPSRVGLANAQQFWDHVAMTPGEPGEGRRFAATGLTHHQPTCRHS
jgi:hypothetical protein